MKNIIKNDCLTDLMKNSIKSITIFDNYEDTINFIKNINIPEDKIFLKIDYPEMMLSFQLEENHPVDNLIRITHNMPECEDIIPKELLELLIPETISRLIVCQMNHTIDPEFKDTKKYMQAQLISAL